MSLAYISHPDCLRHEMGQGHPECPARLRAIEDRLTAAGVFDWLRHVEAPEAPTIALQRAHNALYLAELDAASPATGYTHVDPDTYMNPYTLRAARRAAGALLRAVDGVIGGEFARAFCAVRPPGHHATRGEAMGFCFYDNAAVGVLHALEVHGLARVALVDFDVHHGNGSEHILAGDERVLMVSTFQHPLYPASGVDPLGENMVNVPLPPYSDGAALRGAVTREWLPALERFRPQLIVISAGFDAHRDDDMSQLLWTEADYAWVTQQLVDVAQRHCHGRIVSTLEGGYDLNSLARSVLAHVKVLGGFD
ncbi:MAG: histone deacetylase family protein [Rhodanobacteraceae bacterium]|nr:histone deacetylase family protein [Rhodanobacteraceae bacterium]